MVCPRLVPVGPLSTLLSASVGGEHDLELIVKGRVFVETSDQIRRGVLGIHEEGRVDDGMVRGGRIPLDRVLRSLDERDRGSSVAVVEGGRGRVVGRSRRVDLNDPSSLDQKTIDEPLSETSV